MANTSGGRADRRGKAKTPCEARPATAFGARALRLGLFLALAVIGLACGSRPYGPTFEPAPLPSEHRSRVYVYRVDERTSLATVRVTIDGLEVGRLRDREYETVELPAGTHTVRATMRGFGFVSWGWNDHQLRTRPGEIAYLKLEVRLADVATESATSRGRETEIAGRADGPAASENVFIVPRSDGQALSELRLTTRLAARDGEDD